MRTDLRSIPGGLSRRGFLRAAAGSVALAGLPPHLLAATPDPWLQAQSIIDRVGKPRAFRQEDFPITAFGAKPCDVAPVTAWISFTEQAQVKTPAENSTDCYPAIAAAIAACHKAGGGRVLIPAGNWLCAGPIVLLSNVNVHLASGAHVYFSNNPLDYAKYGQYDCGASGKLSLTRWEGNDCLNYSSMVYAHGQDNIALTGEDWSAILDGQAGVPFEGSADCWWSWKGRERAGAAHVPHTKGHTEVAPNPLNPASLLAVAPQLSPQLAAQIQGTDGRFQADSNFLRALAEARVPFDKRVFGIGHFLRPHMVQFIDCTNVLFAGYQTTNTPFWQHNPVGCRNMHVKGIYANSMGPNSDGFDPESCRDVLIEGCQFNTGDDCIAIDSGKGPDIQYGPAKDIVIQDCSMQSGHGALTLGSIMSGGIENVFAQNLVFENANWNTDPLNIAIRLKTNMSRGGYLRNFHVRDVVIPNGIRTTPAYYATLPGSGIPNKSVATTAGGIITIDCDYQPVDDTVRTRPPAVTGVHISNVKVGDVAAKNGTFSCWQAIVIQGPVAANYNGEGKPKVLPVSDVTIEDCDLGTPANAEHPTYLYNVKGLRLKNVKIGGKVVNQTLSA
jgi:polygalacturonase